MFKVLSALILGLSSLNCHAVCFSTDQAMERASEIIEVAAKSSGFSSAKGKAYLLLEMNDATISVVKFQGYFEKTLVVVSSSKESTASIFQTSSFDCVSAKKIDNQSKPYLSFRTNYVGSYATMMHCRFVGRYKCHFKK